jgi:hypothetical protein
MLATDQTTGRRVLVTKDGQEIELHSMQDVTEFQSRQGDSKDESSDSEVNKKPNKHKKTKE